jgi:hypothetical protein
MAIARQLISDTATQIANEDLDLEDLMLWTI